MLSQGWQQGSHHYESSSQLHRGSGIMVLSQDLTPQLPPSANVLPYQTVLSSFSLYCQATGVPRVLSSAPSVFSPIWEMPFTFQASVTLSLITAPVWVSPGLRSIFPSQTLLLDALLNFRSKDVQNKIHGFPSQPASPFLSQSVISFSIQAPKSEASKLSVSTLFSSFRHSVCH